jgi:hypothetical protein
MRLLKSLSNLRSNLFGRPLAQPLGQDVEDGARTPRRLSATQSLLRRLGLTGGAQVESLEERKLLFSLTVTANDVDPQTGIGTVRAYFGYVIPVLAANVERPDPDDEPATPDTEDFEDAALGGAQPRTFQSGLRIDGNLEIARITNPTLNAEDGGKVLELQFTRQGQVLRFERRNDDPQNPAIRTLTLFAFDVTGWFPQTDATGLDTNQVQINIRLNNEITASFTGAALRQLFAGNPALGTGRITIDSLALGLTVPAFDSVEIVSLGDYGLGGSPRMAFDNFAFLDVRNDFADDIADRVFGAAVVLSGPVGATVSFFDLYNRPMVRTISLGVPQNRETPLVDPDGNLIANFNDGIGRIELNQTDSRTNLQMWGGIIEQAQEPTAGGEFFEPGFEFRLETGLAGIFDAFEGAGFGYIWSAEDGDFNVDGLPEAGGSLIIGSPFVRDNSRGILFDNFGNIIDEGTSNPFGPAVTGNEVTTGFNNANQGVFVRGGASIGTISIPGILHGASRITGSIDRLAVGYLVGSVDIAGDAGLILSATDSGGWAPDPAFAIPGVTFDPARRTASIVTVGRTLGEFVAGGRNLSDITVVGDVNSPTTRPARDVQNYFEREFIQGVSPAEADLTGLRRNLYQGTAAGARANTTFNRTTDMWLLHGAATIRNDIIANAEMVNNGGTAVRITGELSGQDTQNGEDRSDVYAFAVDGTNEVVIQSFNVRAGIGQYFRVMDARGRTIAAAQGPDVRDDQRRFEATEVRFRPEQAGVYYLVLTDMNNDLPEASGSYAYSLVISGLAATTLGGFRSGGSHGYVQGGTDLAASISVLSGSMGSMRVGAGASTAGGTPAPANTIVNTVLDADDVMSFHAGAVSVAGNLFGLIAGGDIGAPNGGNSQLINIIVGGNLGMLYTGVNPLIAGGPREGDWNSTSLNVGGSIGRIDVSGGIGMDQDQDDEAARRNLTGLGVFVRTGTASASSGLRGDIGFFRTGFHVGGDQLDIRTPNGSTIGALLTSQDFYDDTDARVGVYNGTDGLPLRVGAGSDVRFIDFPRIDLQGSVDISFPIVADTPREFVDDSGARIVIGVQGAAPGTVVGQVRVAPVDGSQGVAIAAIEIDLRGGRTLTMQSSTIGNAGVVSVGRIIITGDTTSNFQISGTAEVDVLRTEVIGAIANISNSTVGGDFVTIDAESLDTLDVDGDLGITQVVPFGPRTYAPALGLAGDATGGGGSGVGGPLSWIFDETVIDNDFGGGVYRAENNDNFQGGNGSIDDFGSPLDDIADGLVVRSGNVTRVSVAGRVQDIILQGDDSVLIDAVINDDGVTPLNGFDGLVGSIFAFSITNLNVGDGIAGRTASQVMGAPGVYASNDIVNITSRVRGTMSGIIAAANIDIPDVPVPDFIEGINTISIPGGNAVNAYINVGTLDEFWTSFLYGEEEFSTGDIQNINIGVAPVVTGPDGLPVTDPGLLDGGNFFRSQVQAANLGTMTLAGYFDASRVSMTQGVDTISARGFRNRTIGADRRQFVPSEILIGRDLNTLRATEDIVDQRVDIAGAVTRGVSAVNLVRTQLDVDNITNGLAFTGDVRASTITTGDIRGFTVRNSINASTVLVSGIISGLSVTNRINNSRIEVTGPAGRIDSITAVNGINAQIISSGPIGTISVTAGDLAGEISTAARGSEASNITLLNASRDMLASVNAQGAIATITAGRNIGSKANPRTILATGNITTVTAPTGQLHSDVRSGGNVGSVTLGAAVAKPDNDQIGRGSIVAAGTIGTVTSAGDFGGDIISYTGGITSVTITNGSFLPGRTIGAFDGTIGLISIPNGNLLGNVEAGIDITSLVVGSTTTLGGGTTPGPALFGNVGVDPGRSAFVSVDGLRNQLPPGVGADRGIDGSLIRAGRNIVSVTIAGSVFESGFYAGQQLQTVTVGGRVANNTDFGTPGSFFAAGDRINSITAGVSIADTVFIAGAVSLGADNRPGGRGSNADVIKPGVVQNITTTDGLFGVAIAAGAEAGADGRYGTADDRLSLGAGEVRGLTVAGQFINTRVVADVVSGAIKNDPRFLANNNAVLDAQPLSRFVLDNGLGVPEGRINGSRTVLVNGTQLTATFSGAGEAYLETFVTVDALTGEQLVYPTIILRNTRGGGGASGEGGGGGSSGGSILAVSTTNGFIDNLRILSNDDASLSRLTLSGELRGESQIVVDAGIDTLALGSMNLRSSNNFTNSSVPPGIYTGGTISTLTGVNVGAGFIEALNVGAITLTGNFTSNLQAVGIGAVSVVGLGGVLSADRAIASITASGNLESARVRAGTTLGQVTGGTIRRSIIAAGDSIAGVTARGEVFDSAISAGVDTGRDAAFEGTGLSSDVLSGGSVGNVIVGGDFRESDITAGLDRGADRFFGTVDDRLAGGRSNIGSVTIAGNIVGSTRSSETYRIASTGTIGRVSIAGQTVTGARGNFAVQAQLVPPQVIQVREVATSVDAQVFSTDLVFNQPMDAASLRRALTVSEVRGTGGTRISLIQDIDYTTQYIESTNTLRVTFAREITQRNLPQLSGRPGAGIYDFFFEQDVLRARVQSARLDGNGNGVVDVSDDYVGTTQVGDAGDRLSATIVNNAGGRVDLYQAVNLNFVFDDPTARDGVADANKTYTIRGAIGDHPDNNTTTFRFSGDIDLYRVTLQAGQILRLGQVSGAAALTPIALFTGDGTAVAELTDNPTALSLPTAATERIDLSRSQAYLIKVTGEYVIGVGQGVAGALQAPGTLVNPDPTNFSIGDYRFDVTIFDDADTGFTASTNSGDGKNLVEAPRSIEFAGIDGVFGTPDDVSELVRDEYTFTLNRGADNAPNTADDVVSATSQTNAVASIVESTRSSAGVTQVIRSALGEPGFAGAPSNVLSDVDVYHLNGREAITPGTKYRVTVRLSEQGSDLGSRLASGLDDVGSVQFGVFDTTGSTNIDDAAMLFSPTDFEPYGGTPNTTIANDGSTRYGYDASGDFFIEWVTPSAQVFGGAGTFAVYLQGIVQSDYQLVVENLGAASTPARKTQNIFIETNGGDISWLEAGGLTTRLEGFNVSRLGFTGSVNGTTSVQNEVLSRSIASLNALFQGSGFDVNFSTNPGDFEFQEFSTIFLSNTVDPIVPIYSAFDSFNFFQFFFGDVGFVPTNPFGASQRSDPLNARLEDEAVVFVPSFTLLGYVPSAADVDNLVQSLTSSIARRSGEIMGLRIADTNTQGTALDPMGSDSVFVTPEQGQTYVLTNTLRDLSSSFDSTQRENFFLGQQRTFGLLDRIISRS